jgi:penicillin-binding protein 1A
LTLQPWHAQLLGFWVSGRIVGGGSTITQQTVKNILDRWENTFQRKFYEAIAAKQLERIYTKKEILEFYLNQFHVTSNGKGLKIAAKYYFNKEVRDLSLVEAAFIAGSVKGPSKYNPHMKYTKVARDTAKKNAFHRKNYVIGRMLAQSWISQEEHDEALLEEIPFKLGKFKTQQVNIAQSIREFIDKKEILDALGLESIEELTTSGYSVFTTLDHDLQYNGQLSIRRNLSRLETILTNFEKAPENAYTPLTLIEPDHFYYGKVLEIKNTPKAEELILTFGYRDGILKRDALERYAKLLDLPTGEGFEKILARLLTQIKVGDVLYTEVRGFDENDNALLELHKRPNINGGLIAIDKGDIKAVISGFDTGGFNRALHAMRPPGSVFKSVVYYAAMQLGWTVLDRLDNERQVFPFQGTFYYPRPDHRSPYPDTSMMWAGVMSENLASVHLAYHLLDKINYDQFKQLLATMGYYRKDNEDTRAFLFRLAKGMGVDIDAAGIKERQLRNAIIAMNPDLIFDGQESVMRHLNKMWWGRNYQNEIISLSRNAALRYMRSEEDEQELSNSERLVRINMVKNNFMRMESVAEQLNTDWSLINQLISQNGVEAVQNLPQFRSALVNFRVLSSQGRQPELGYYMNAMQERLLIKNEAPISNVFNPLAGRELNSADIQAIWGIVNQDGSAPVTLSRVKMEGYLPVHIFLKLKSRVERLYDEVVAKNDPDQLFKYFEHSDFRVIVGLNFLVELAKMMGITSPLQPVISFPLGTNEVTAAEVAKVYQTLVSGKIYQFYQDKTFNQLNLIKRVEDRTGKVLYEAKREERALALPQYSHQMQQILRKIVTHGTGRRANGELFIEIPSGDKKLAISVPAFGKTGTTNDYTTSYFAGFIPYPTQVKAPLDPNNHLVITSYVGYDRNKPMKRGRYRVSGAMGALPVWTDFGKFMLSSKKYADFVDPLDLKVLSQRTWPLKNPSDSQNISIDLPRGIVVDGRVDLDESARLTNLQKTGESFESEFAVGAMVSSIVNLPRDKFSSGAWAPMRLFSPFVNYNLETTPLPPTSSKISPVDEKGAAIEPESQNPEINNDGQNIEATDPADTQNEEDESVVTYKSAPEEKADINSITVQPVSTDSAAATSSSAAEKSAAEKTTPNEAVQKPAQNGIPPTSPLEAKPADSNESEEDLW